MNCQGHKGNSGWEAIRNFLLETHKLLPSKRFMHKIMDITQRRDVMKSRSRLSILVLVLAMLACNLPSNIPTETPTAAALTPSSTQAPATATLTLTVPPSNTPPPTSTSTPSVPVAFPREVAVNCRLGPGTEWIVLSGLGVGTSSEIKGKSGDAGWWQIIDPLNSGRRCWVAASVTNTAGNVANIPVVDAPEAAVTNVTVKVKPESLSVVGCTGSILPFEITGTIETNGPGTVQWQFETQQDGPMSTQTTTFEAFGEETVSVNYTPTTLTAGTFWVRLIVTSPNEEQAEAKYTIVCA
jgi:hypothetical protein